MFGANWLGAPYYGQGPVFGVVVLVPRHHPLLALTVLGARVTDLTLEQLLTTDVRVLAATETAITVRARRVSDLDALGARLTRLSILALPTEE